MYKRQVIAAVIMKIGGVYVKDQLAVEKGVLFQSTGGDHAVLFQMCIRDRYKTAPNEEEREQARQEYLDRRGVPQSYRWTTPPWEL